MLFDTSSGIGRGVMSIILASPEVCLVITPEPTSLTDAYGMVKLLYRDGFAGQLSVIADCVHAYLESPEPYNEHLDRWLGTVYPLEEPG